MKILKRLARAAAAASSPWRECRHGRRRPSGGDDQLAHAVHQSGDQPGRPTRCDDRQSVHARDAGAGLLRLQHDLQFSSPRWSTRLVLGSAPVRGPTPTSRTSCATKSRRSRTSRLRTSWRTPLDRREVRPPDQAPKRRGEVAPQASPTIVEPRTGAMLRDPRSTSGADAAADALRSRNPNHLHVLSPRSLSRSLRGSVRTWTV